MIRCISQLVALLLTPSICQPYVVIYCAYYSLICIFFYQPPTTLWSFDSHPLASSRPEVHTHFINYWQSLSVFFKLYKIAIMMRIVTMSMLQRLPNFSNIRAVMTLTIFILHRASKVAKKHPGVYGFRKFKAILIVCEINEITSGLFKRSSRP